ncbi:hypothetical protein IU500_03300 [Nocardia terpenica]|uniref:Uncharacterized protein n=1 Tax=Nocardia terpenica TaxID=455432 RepID=A0A164LN35_9NOCA|nr:hypothetical protein [Nocardia terpenica]KZM72590.1 hypothetical protein AWN90_27720 [Nocardia terpenica]MBF6059394.1 hypothetical protein [Nocardia terpenica]MBF6103067.1 hypothetical protein [Nocardia terpenica]MBF6110744.1 hypothetical protein [Nocardia terpenica]MBF6116875.1 hypothetical protein [Nocardia terpenica]
MPIERTIFSDYNQIHLFDADSVNHPWDEWTDYPLTLAEDAVGILTGVNTNVLIAFEVTEIPTSEHTHDFDAVLEFSLRVDSGYLVVSSPTWVPDADDRVTVPRGWLRLRVSIACNPFENEPDYDDDPDDPVARQRLFIHCWPAARGATELIKGYDPEPAG